jgi:anthranilate phosphoribosyltransferase
VTDRPADLKRFLGKLALRQTLTETEAAQAFEVIMSGDATPAQIGAFLMALRVRGETVDEITGAVRVMRARALHVTAPPEAIDIVGTGGDSAGTLNISTGAALVVAASGVPVAKHGNRAVSSKCGSADVLSALGVDIAADPSCMERAIREVGIGFLMAPRYHAAMRHVAGPRVELGIRTVFNLLGPLSNPAGVRRQFSGAFARDWIAPMAKVLGNLGCERAWVVHGSDGLDELTTTGPTFVAEWRDGDVHEFEVSPADAGLPLARAEDLQGGDIATNVAAMRKLLAGGRGPFRDAVVLNAAAALVVAERVADLREGTRMASESIDSGRANQVLDRLVALTQSWSAGGGT